ncbi:alpha/beta-hydrolase [Stereum hirsutum FP-91666 SS1]|uniref:Alpha/beta-hydrolase n=1 Tax=Stereum hirsutum (strain FP-91666) TaxID=721885 RepID=R7S1E5_STEHR|nr:alpha/beta-hydrolase [Stereum hirsutum FP-91666 SS1]EIM80392.1 alpha/beta-hydrolase [Stereum hirsutum FP-91666 SS1]
MKPVRNNITAPLRLVSDVLLLSGGITSVCGHSQTRTVSLLFENDGNWTRFADVPSALYYYEPVSFSEATSICEASNETLLGSDLLPYFSNQFSYKKYLGEIDSTTKIWVSDNSSQTEPVAHAPLDDMLVQSRGDKHSEAAKHPVLCTNSPPLTSQVDTNFSSEEIYPRTTIESDGVTFTGTRDHLSFRFMGIPYAKPPTGELRFRYSEASNVTDVDATGFGPACPQFGYFNGNDYGLMPWGNSEDCLFLNVYTSYIPSSSDVHGNQTSLKPVLFWIHGGGATQGTGADATFDGGPLVSRTDAVVVTINYRLNILGLLALNDTTSSNSTTTSSAAVTGNYALSDKILALKWVRRHIAAFGGDPNKVMIFGQSAGGWGVVDLLMTEKTEETGVEGLWSSAIIQSGGASVIQSLDEAAETILPYIDPLCPSAVPEERLSCLQSLDLDTLLNITQNVTSWRTSADGVYRSTYAVDQAKLGPDAVNSVPLLSGYMPEEGQSLLGTTVSPNSTASNFTTMLDLTVGEAVAENVTASGLWNITDAFTSYNATVDVYSDYLLTCDNEDLITSAAASKAFPDIYVYQMQRGFALSYYNPYGLCSFPVGEPQPYYRCHSSDLHEVFGTYHIFNQTAREPQDVYYTNLIQDMWASFARTGNPNPDVAYLRARGYNSTLAIFSNSTESEGQAQGWKWPKFEEESAVVAELQWPILGNGTRVGMPDAERCKVILGED